MSDADDAVAPVELLTAADAQYEFLKQAVYSKYERCGIPTAEKQQARPVGECGCDGTGDAKTRCYISWDQVGEALKKHCDDTGNAGQYKSWFFRGQPTELAQSKMDELHGIALEWKPASGPAQYQAPQRRVSGSDRPRVRNPIFGWRPKTKEAGLHRASKRTTAEPQRLEDDDSSGRPGAGKKAKGKAKAAANAADGTYYVGVVKKVCMHAAPPSIIILSKTIDARLRADVFSWGVARQDVIMIERGAVAQATLGEYFTAYSDELFDAFPKVQVPRQVTGRQIANALAEDNKSFAYDIETGANNGVGMTLDVNDKTYSIIKEGGSELLRGMWNRTKNTEIVDGSVSMQGYDAKAMQENGQWVRAVELPMSKELVAGSNLFPFVKQQCHWSSLHCIAARTRTLNRSPH